MARVYQRHTIHLSIWNVSRQVGRSSSANLSITKSEEWRVRLGKLKGQWHIRTNKWFDQVEMDTVYEQRTKPIVSAKGHCWNGRHFWCVLRRSWGFGDIYIYIYYICIYMYTCVWTSSKTYLNNTLRSENKHKLLKTSGGLTNMSFLFTVYSRGKYRKCNWPLWYHVLENRSMFFLESELTCTQRTLNSDVFPGESWLGTKDMHWLQGPG